MCPMEFNLHKRHHVPEGGDTSKRVKSSESSIDQADNFDSYGYTKHDSPSVPSKQALEDFGKLSKEDASRCILKLPAQIDENITEKCRNSDKQLKNTVSVRGVLPVKSNVDASQQFDKEKNAQYTKVADDAKSCKVFTSPTCHQKEIKETEKTGMQRETPYTVILSGFPAEFRSSRAFEVLCMPYGSVQEVNVHLPSGLVGDGLSASIKMGSREECEKLIEGLNVYGGHNKIKATFLKDVNATVECTNTSKTDEISTLKYEIHISGLPSKFNSSEKLKTMASEYGVISEARLLPRSRGSNTRDGLITTSTKDEFTKLLETLNNKILKGSSKMLHVQPHNSDHSWDATKSQIIENKIYMTRIPNHYTKEKLKNICGACGKVLDVQIEQTNAEYCSKSAIIEMESEESCKKIITKYNEKCAPESRQKLHVKFAQVRDISKEEVQQINVLEEKEDVTPFPKQETVVYIRGLRRYFTREDLNALIESTGIPTSSIISTFIFIPERFRPGCSGIFQLRTNTECCHVISKLDGQKVSDCDHPMTLIFKSQMDKHHNLPQNDLPPVRSNIQGPLWQTVKEKPRAASKSSSKKLKSKKSTNNENKVLIASHQSSQVRVPDHQIDNLPSWSATDITPPLPSQSPPTSASQMLTVTSSQSESHVPLDHMSPVASHVLTAWPVDQMPSPPPHNQPPVGSHSHLHCWNDNQILSLHTNDVSVSSNHLESSPENSLQPLQHRSLHEQNQIQVSHSNQVQDLQQTQFQSEPSKQNLPLHSNHNPIEEFLVEAKRKEQEYNKQIEHKEHFLKEQSLMEIERRGTEMQKKAEQIETERKKKEMEKKIDNTLQHEGDHVHGISMARKNLSSYQYVNDDKMCYPMGINTSSYESMSSAGYWERLTMPTELEDVRTRQYLLHVLEQLRELGIPRLQAIPKILDIMREMAPQSLFLLSNMEPALLEKIHSGDPNIFYKLAASNPHIEHVLRNMNMDAVVNLVKTIGTAACQLLSATFSSKPEMINHMDILVQSLLKN